MSKLNDTDNKRYWNQMQDNLDFLPLKKQVKYKFKKKKMSSEILRMIIDTEAFSNEMVRLHLCLFH